MSQVASRADREYLLESLINPNAKIAKGFGVITRLRTDGRVISGVVQEEDDDHTVVKTGDGQTVDVAQADIEARTSAGSPMPAFGKMLKKHEIRDLIEFLSTQRTEEAGSRKQKLVTEV